MVLPMHTHLFVMIGKKLKGSGKEQKKIAASSVLLQILKARN